MPPNVDSTPTGSQNSFFGVKVSQPGVDVNNADPNQLLYQNNYSQETFYGTGGNVSFGVNSDNSLGMQVEDTAGNVTFELNGQTWIWYDQNGIDIMRVGLLPDGSYGWAVATPGNSVAAAFGA